MELPKIKDFVAVADPGLTENEGCNVCWFGLGSGYSRCCNKENGLRALLYDLELHLHTECGMDGIHYELKTTGDGKTEN